MSTLIIKNGRIHDAVREQAYVADIWVLDGKIAQIGTNLAAELRGGQEDTRESAGGAQENGQLSAVKILDASGLDVYPGFIDAHCHIGLDGYGIGFEGEDFNEMGDPVTPDLSAIDGINPQDITFEHARSGGVTCVCTGPGSSNVIGGTFCVIKTAGHRVDDMIVKEKAGMKIAFGENPKNCYKTKGVYSRMSIGAKLRENLRKAVLYDAKLCEAGALGEEEVAKQRGIDWSKMPTYDPKMEALLPVIRGELPLKTHAHRADDIFTAIRIAKEFGLSLAIDHTTEGHLIAEDLAAEGYPVSVGPNFGHATKYELRNRSFETPAILSKAGCSVSIITDSPVIEQRFLRYCVGQAILSGMDSSAGLKSVTINAAKHIGVQDRVGSIETGKDGDFVIVKGSPFSPETKVLYTIIDGKIVYQG